jgi:hypothetical protein
MMGCFYIVSGWFYWKWGGYSACMCGLLHNKVVLLHIGVIALLNVVFILQNVVILLRNRVVLLHN